jgi:hypothetical protein
VGGGIAGGVIRLAVAGSSSPYSLLRYLVSRLAVNARFGAVPEMERLGRIWIQLLSTCRAWGRKSMGLSSNNNGRDVGIRERSGSMIQGQVPINRHGSVILALALVSPLKLLEILGVRFERLFMYAIICRIISTVTTNLRSTWKSGRQSFSRDSPWWLLKSSRDAVKQGTAAQTASPTMKTS